MGTQLEETAEGIPTRAVQRDDPANTAPEFPKDNDPNTPGQPGVAERSVKENAKNEKVGDRIRWWRLTATC